MSSRQWLARLARRAGGAAEAQGAIAPAAAARHSSSLGGGASGPAVTGGAAHPPLQQILPAALGPLAQLQQQQHAQQHLQMHQSAGRRILGEPVFLDRSEIIFGSAALVGFGVAAGVGMAQQHTDAPGTAQSAAAQAAGAAATQAPTSGSSGSAAGEALHRSQQWLTDYLFSFKSHTQATSPAADLRGSSSIDTAPLGGCLSPYYISDAAAKAAPAVVNITVQGSGALPVGSSGSGFIVDSDGTILTNAHVVSDAIQRHYYGGGLGSNGINSGSSAGGANGGAAGGGAAASAATAAAISKGITVTLQDGRIFEGRLVSYDTVSDLAVLKVETDAPLPTAKLGRSASLRVGEWVVALGSPLHLQNSVTAGIVSCVDRKAVELGLAGARTDYIQTDASINKGNSGGPLVNLFGEVVGISAMKAVAADGVSFAIPVDTAVDVMRQLKEHGRVIRPYVGIKMLQLNKHNAAQFRKRDPNFPRVASGILVPGVHPGSPAERAGLMAGDVIIGFGNCTHDATTTALIKALGQHIGRQLELRVARPGDKVVTLTVVALEANDGLH